MKKQINALLIFCKSNPVWLFLCIGTIELAAYLLYAGENIWIRILLSVVSITSWFYAMRASCEFWMSPGFSSTGRVLIELASICILGSIMLQCLFLFNSPAGFFISAIIGTLMSPVIVAVWVFTPHAALLGNHIVAFLKRAVRIFYPSSFKYLKGSSIDQ